ncbi:MAG: rRNA maturation RNase YbeY [Bacteroidota bacterium]
MSGTIHFFAEDIQYTIRGKTKIRKWIIDTAEAENKAVGEICIIVCTDEYLKKINHKYLKHNTLTDIITFPLMDDRKLICGDMYISLPRVRENAVKFAQKVENELHLVIIHGVLHLLGYNDISEDDTILMKLKEYYYLAKLTEN